MADLIEDFVDATKHIVSPERFRRWTAISLISAVMGRKVWTSIRADRKLYPNTYVLLVAPPGIGKNEPMEVLRDLLIRHQSISFAPDEITPEKMIQDLGEVFGPNYDPGMTGHEKTYMAMIPELGTFMPTPNVQFIQALARIWDCPTIYTRKTKHAGIDTLEYPFMCILAGAQPAWFAEGFPPNAYEMGLPARLFLIYSDEHVESPYFTGARRTSMDTLQRKLIMIGRMRGEVRFTPEAQRRWNRWADTTVLPDGWKPRVDDPMLKGYGVRRNMHAGKLALIVAAARHPTRLEIDTSDLDRAMEIMFEAETLMPNAVSGAGGNMYRLKEESVIGFITGRFADTGKTVPEWQVRQRLGRIVPMHILGPILDGLVATRAITAMGGKAPNRRFKPSKEGEDA